MTNNIENQKPNSETPQGPNKRGVSFYVPASDAERFDSMVKESNEMGFDICGMDMVLNDAVVAHTRRVENVIKKKRNAGWYKFEKTMAIVMSILFTLLVLTAFWIVYDVIERGTKVSVFEENVKVDKRDDCLLGAEGSRSNRK